MTATPKSSTMLRENAPAPTPGFWTGIDLPHPWLEAHEVTVRVLGESNPRDLCPLIRVEEVGSGKQTVYHRAEFYERFTPEPE